MDQNFNSNYGTMNHRGLLRTQKAFLLGIELNKTNEWKYYLQMINMNSGNVENSLIHWPFRTNNMIKRINVSNATHLQIFLEVFYPCLWVNRNWNHTHFLYDNDQSIDHQNWSGEMDSLYPCSIIKRIGLYEST
jgi:hypothetical protein